MIIYNLYVYFDMYKYLYAKVKLLTPFFPFPLLQKVKYLKVQYISRSKAQ